MRQFILAAAMMLSAAPGMAADAYDTALEEVRATFGTVPSFMASMSRAALPGGFVEFRRHLGNCRFSDCRHLGDMGCALQAAVERGEIDTRRYASYVELRRLIERLA